MNPTQEKILQNKKIDPPKFGTFIGVFVPSILMVFGVIVFLRMGWIVGTVGLATTFALISLSMLICLITTLSMASIATNITLGNGGVYHILSRCLGLELGSALGIPLYLKQSLSIAFCILGFSESFHALIPALSLSSISLATLAVFSLLAYYSISGALRVQLAIFGLIALSFFSLFGGDAASFSQGAEKIAPPPLGFWAVFAIFFPAMTGVEASVSLSSNLKNPSKSIPLGTISALFVAYGIYMFIPWFLTKNLPLSQLEQDPLIMQKIAKIPFLIILGIWGATLSSALGGLLGAPRTLQALAIDRVVPLFLGKEVGEKKRLLPATLLTLCFVLSGLYLGGINQIAPLLSMVCLICYAVLNTAVGLESLMDNPHFRPRFRIHWTISMVGGILCLLSMLMIHPQNALLAWALIFLLYLVAKRRRLQGSWEDMRYAVIVFLSRFAIHRLVASAAPSKTWRPHFLVFAKTPSLISSGLLQFSQAISKGKSFVTLACFYKEEDDELEKAKQLETELKRYKLPILNHSFKTKDPLLSMQQMLQTYGLGSLVPNTIVWGGVDEKEKTAFAGLVADAHLSNRQVIILSEPLALKSSAFNHDPLNAFKFQGNIDIWIKNTEETNLDLLLILAHMLKRDPHFKKSTISLKMAISHDSLRATTLDALYKILQEKRMSALCETIVNVEEAPLSSLISRFSKGAGIVLRGLETPFSSLEEYGNYLSQEAGTPDKTIPIAHILSSNASALSQILT